MAKQLVKNLSMLTLVVGLALAAGVQSANGQTTSHAVTAAIPFDFVVGDKTLPAGKYMVSSATQDGSGLKIQNRNAKPAVFRFTSPINEKSTKRTAKMVFHRYGEQYFLAEIWSADGAGRALRQSKLERNIRQELASNSSKESYQLVEVAMLR